MDIKIRMREVIRQMKTVQRYEEAEILDYTEDEDDGFLTVELAATRAGVMPYFDNQTGEVVMELKPEDEIFSDITMNSIKGVPITDRHPPVMLNTKNWKDFTKGTTHLNPRKDGNLLVIDETLFDDELIAYVKSGKKEQVSIGFRAELEEKSGTYDGKEYDRIQRNIRINHVAHVEQGRAGEKVKARIDSKKPVGYSIKLDGYTPPNPDNYGTTQENWGDPTPSIGGLGEMSESEIEAIMPLYAWVDNDDPSEITNKSTDLKLPHHNTDGDVVWNGVVAAMAAVNGARGGVEIPDGDLQDVYEHLANHYTDDFDEEPPELGDSKMEINLTKEGDKSMDKELMEVSFDSYEGLDFDKKVWIEDGTKDEFDKVMDEIMNRKDRDEPEIELTEIEIGDETIRVAEGDAEKIKNLIDKKDELEGKLDSKKDEVDNLESRIDELENENLEEIVQDRLDLIDTAREFIDSFDASGKSAKEIKVEVIKKLDEDFEAEEKSDEYINARFDGAVSTLRKLKSDSYGDNNLMTKKRKDKNDELSKKKQERKNLKK